MSGDWELMLRRARDALAPILGEDRTEQLLRGWVEQAGGRPLDAEKMMVIARTMQASWGHSRLVGRALERVSSRTRKRVAGGLC